MLKGSSGSRVDFLAKTLEIFNFTGQKLEVYVCWLLSFAFFPVRCFKVKFKCISVRISHIFSGGRTPSSTKIWVLHPTSSLRCRDLSRLWATGKSLEEPSSVWYFFSVTLKYRVLNHYWYYYESLLILLSKSKFRYVISEFFESRCAFEQAFWTIGYIGLAWISGRFGSVWVMPRPYIIGSDKKGAWWPSILHGPLAVIVWFEEFELLVWHSEMTTVGSSCSGLTSSNVSTATSRLHEWDYHMPLLETRLQTKESELKNEPQNAYLQKEYLHATSFKGDITFLSQRM